MPNPDWNPDSYARFRDLRLRPALDLLAQVPQVPPGPVVDLGCGDGAAGAALAARYGAVEGVDNSAAMLDRARTAGHYTRLTLADIGDWAPGTPPALIFSNAALQWLPDHDTLFPRLAALLAPGGTLAVQMPAQSAAPSHALLRSTAADLFPDRPAPQAPAPVLPPETYHRMLSSLGAVTIWDTTYLQHQPPVPEGHPVRAFTQSTAMRPFVAGLTPDRTATFLAAYDAALDLAYPRLPDGSALFPFRRLFIILTV